MLFCRVFILFEVNWSMSRVAILQLIRYRCNSNSYEQHSQICVRDRIETDKKHPNVASSGVITMGNNKIIYVQFLPKMSILITPRPWKSRKYWKGVQRCQIFANSSHCVCVYVCEVMGLVTSRVMVVCDNNTSGSPLPPPPPLPSQF